MHSPIVETRTTRAGDQRKPWLSVSLWMPHLDEELAELRHSSTV
jgi:hypothetical protein